MKTAIVGLGYIGKVHLLSLGAVPQVQELVLVDPNQEEAKRVAKNFWHNTSLQRLQRNVER